MKHTIISIAVLASLGLSACSTTPKVPEKSPLEKSAEYTTPVKETRMSLDFADEGIKISYTSEGKLERIEVYGVAPAWKNNVDIIAEADAMSKLVKFIHGKNVTSNRSIKLIGKTLENSRDNMANNFKSRAGTLAKADDTSKTSSDATSETPIDLSDSDGRLDEKSSEMKRKASVVNETMVNEIVNITSSGHLTGVRKIGDRIKDDGKLYIAIYQWSIKDQETSDMVRKMMTR
jgi:hypothetical protein